jgi:hypothetical protein
MILISSTTSLGSFTTLLKMMLFLVRNCAESEKTIIIKITNKIGKFCNGPGFTVAYDGLRVSKWPNLTQLN